MTLVVALQGDLPPGGELHDARVRRWLYVGDDTVWRIGAEHGELAGIERIPSAEAIQEAAWRLRRPYIEWIGGLSRANDSAEWWASELAAKNSYAMLFSNVSSLAAARDLAPESEALAVCSSPALARELLELPQARQWPSRSQPHLPYIGNRPLRTWASFAPGPLVGLPGAISERARMSLDTDPRYRRRILADRGAQQAGFEGDDAMLVFTWIDRRSFPPEGGYRDLHLGALPELLRARGVRIAYVPRVLHAMPFAEAVDRMLASGERFIFPDLYLGRDDWRACTRRANAFAPAIPDGSTVGGVPVRRLALEHVARHRSAQAVALSYELLVRNLATAGVRPARIVHPYEGHTWELSLIRSVRSHLPSTRVIGYENLNMSRFALSMYPASGELGLRPLPDRIVTNGPAFRRVLLAEGLPEKLVREGCGLRHAELWSRAAQPSGLRPAGAPLRILAATDGTLGGAAELVAKAVAAFGGDGRYDLTVKCHPLVPQARVETLLAAHTRPANVRFSDEPFEQALAAADVLLYTHSVVCYEALMRGVPPIFVGSESVVDLDQLEPFPDLRRKARTPEEIRRAVDEIAALDYTALRAWQEQARAAAADALRPADARCVDAFLD